MRSRTHCRRTWKQEWFNLKKLRKMMNRRPNSEIHRYPNQEVINLKKSKYNTPSQKV